MAFLRHNATLPAGPANARYLLWIDGVGAYLLCLGQRVTIGGQRPDGTNADVPLMANLSRTHATFLRGAEGYVLEAGRLYLGRTLEYTETHGLVPMLEGRSSIGRLGLFVHITAGFGDVGFRGFWTLEMICLRPVRIYAGVEICQIFYHTVEGEILEYKSGKYQGNRDIQPSMLYKEFLKSETVKKP